MNILDSRWTAVHRLGRNKFEIHHLRVKPKQAIGARGGGGFHVVVVKVQIVVAAVGPKQTAAGIADEVVVKHRWPRRQYPAEFRHQIAYIIFLGKIEEIVVHLHAVT